MPAMIIAWLLYNWKTLLMSSIASAFSAFLAYHSGHGIGYHFGYSTGQTDLRAEIARQVKEKINASEIADRAVSDCARDPACRVRDDGFRRD